VTSTGLYLTVAAGGAVGAPARYLLDIAVAARGRGGHFPLGTFIVNASGAFLFGLVFGAAVHHGLSDAARAAVGTGFCGAYTTFSTFSNETVRLVEKGSLMAAALNLGGSLAVGLVAAALGLGLALVL